MRDLEGQKVASDLLPEVFHPAGTLPGGVEQCTTTLLHLVDEDGEHHQMGEDVQEIAMSMPKIMPEFVAMKLLC